MKPLQPRTLLPVQVFARARWLRVIAHADWPVLAGLSAGVCGLLMLGAAWYLPRHANHALAATTPAISNQAPGQHSPNLSTQSSEATFSAPAPGTHLDDLGRLFKLAKEQGVNIGTIEYRFETSTAMPLLIRTLDLRMNEEYPKLKAFVAELLSTMPHVSLQEIRVERKDASALQEQVLLKLSFVYQTAAKNSAVAPGEYRSRSPDAAPGDQTTLP